jgi:hypothetical protein
MFNTVNTVKFFPIFQLKSDYSSDQDLLEFTVSCSVNTKIHSLFNSLCSFNIKIMVIKFVGNQICNQSIKYCAPAVGFYLQDHPLFP